MPSAPNCLLSEFINVSQHFLNTLKLGFNSKLFPKYWYMSRLCVPIVNSWVPHIKERKWKPLSCLHGLYSSWNSPGQNTGVGSLSLLQRIFWTQGLNPVNLHCRQILYQLSHKGSPHVKYLPIRLCHLRDFIALFCLRILIPGKIHQPLYNGCIQLCTVVAHMLVHGIMHSLICYMYSFYK